MICYCFYLYLYRLEIQVFSQKRLISYLFYPDEKNKNKT